MTARNIHPRVECGFALVELVIVLVVVAILAAVGVMNSFSPVELSLPSQAEKLASDIRYAQTLAHTTGTRMGLNITTAGANGIYTVVCVVPASPCSQGFSTQLEKKVVLGGSPTSIEFDTLGQPKTPLPANADTSASYTLTFGGVSKTVSVAALTGFVTVTSP